MIQLMSNIHVKSIALALAVVLSGSCRKEAADAVALDVPAPVVAAIGANYALLMWEAVDNAAAYELLVDDKDVLKTEETTAYINGLSAETGHTVAIKALAPEGSDKWKDSDYCTPLSFTTSGKDVLPAPDVKAVTVLSNKIVFGWAAISGAGSYKYCLNEGPEQETETNQVTVENLNYSTLYSFKVKSVPDATSAEYYKESDWARISVSTADPIRLESPALRVDAITPNGFVLLWDAIQFAGRYEYSINNAQSVFVTEPAVAIEDLTASTEYEVKVRAVPSAEDEGSFVPSEWAGTKVTTLDIIELDAPVLTVSEVSDIRFTVSWEPVDNAEEYVYTFNGDSPNRVSAQTLTFVSLSPETEYTFSVKAVPSEAGLRTYKESKVTEIVVKTKKPASEDDKGGDLSDFEEGSLF